MGKKGDALRAQKAKSATYTFTAEQLEEHDKLVIETFWKKKCGELNRKVDECNKALEDRKKSYEEEVFAYVKKDFEQREKMLTGKATDVTANIFSMLISISVYVLVRDFGWKPIFNHTNRMNRLVRFVNAVNAEAEMLINDETQDIRRYAEMVYEYAGVKFVPEDGESDG